MEYYFSIYDIARMVAEVEAHGVAFYRRLQSDSSDRTMSEMWAFFAEQEQQHKAKFLAMGKEHSTSEDNDLYATNIQNMLETSIEPMVKLMDDRSASGQTLGDVSESLALAAELEATAIRAYTHMKEVSSDRFCEVLTSVIDEEREHLRMIQGVQQRLSFPPAQ